MFILFLAGRAATDRRIELDQQKRNEIERLKQAEVEAQRADVSSWQATVGQQGAAKLMSGSAANEAQQLKVECDMQIMGRVIMRRTPMSTL